MLHTVLKEAQRPIVEVKPHTDAVSLKEVARWIACVPTAVEGTVSSADEPAVIAVLPSVVNTGL
jgi:hypothetical protein